MKFLKTHENFFVHLKINFLSFVKYTSILRPVLLDYSFDGVLTNEIKVDFISDLFISHHEALLLQSFWKNFFFFSQ